MKVCYETWLRLPPRHPPLLGDALPRPEVSERPRAQGRVLTQDGVREHPRSYLLAGLFGQAAAPRHDGPDDRGEEHGTGELDVVLHGPEADAEGANRVTRR